MKDVENKHNISSLTQVYVQLDNYNINIFLK